MVALFLQSGPAAAAQVRQLCLSCHSSHYVERGVCTVCHRGNASSVRKNIAHQQLIAGRYAAFTLGESPQLRAGERLLEQYACRRCHLIAGRGNRLAADLDRSLAHRSPEETSESILHPVQNMPDFHLSRQQAILVINALLAASARTPGDSVEQRQVVHFDRATKGGADIFSRKCGACHRALTTGLGGVGQGEVGPNLSGLLSPYYPPSFGDGTEWTEQKLATWLKNPRRIRPWARMQPVEVTGKEFRELLGILKVTAH